MGLMFILGVVVTVVAALLWGFHQGTSSQRRLDIREYAELCRCPVCLRDREVS